MINAHSGDIYRAPDNKIAQFYDINTIVSRTFSYGVNSK